MKLEKATHLLAAILSILIGGPVLSYAETPPSPVVVEQLLQMDVEQLLSMEVTSVTRKPQKLSDTASAVYIITQDEIRRSGATNIPEALRLAPDVQVARIGADKWAISIRGFNARFSNKLLVLMDGRTVYDPVYTGVFWHAQDTVMEDIARIEVIRGPGAALWGANAVNGIINIITKSARQTQGNLVTARVGNVERGELDIRHGGQWGEDTAYRVYAKGFKQAASVTVNDQDANDAWRAGQTGFRLDSRLSAQENWTLQGDFRRDSTGDTAVVSSLFPPYNVLITPRATTQSYNLLTRYNRRTETTDNTLQIYYNASSYDADSGVNNDHATFDLDWQQHLLSSGPHDWLWGLGYRWLRHQYSAEPYVFLNPEEVDWQWFTGFLQDEIELNPELFLTLGAKLEHNDITGWEFQPSIRLLWNVTPMQTLWTAISRAARTPSRAEAGVVTDFLVIPPFSPENPSDLPIQTRVFGNPAITSETVESYEGGWRQQWNTRLSTDLALFWNNYQDLRSVTAGTPFLELEPAPHLVLPFTLNNDLSGHTYGVELAANWHPFDDWKLQASYSHLWMVIDDPATEAGNNPHHQLSLLSSLAVSPQVEWNMWLRYVDELPNLQIPAYTSLDMRLAWSPHADLTFSLVGQNLLDDHPEFDASSEGQIPTEIERSIYLKALWRF